MLSNFEDVAESLLAIPKRDRAAVWKRALPRAERLKAEGVSYPARLFRALDEALGMAKPKRRRRSSWVPILSGPPPGHTWRSFAAELLGDTEDEGLLRAGAVLLAALHVGPVNAKVVAATGVPIGEVLNYGFRLRSVNIWERGKVNYSWLRDFTSGETELATVGFVAHCMLAVGDLVMDEDERFRLAVIGEGNDGRPHCEPGEDLTGAWRHVDMRLERQARAAHHANRKQLV